jgi:DNA-binding IclR family transcriptional regulator
MRTEGFVESAAEGRLYTVGRQFYRVAARVMASTSPADRAQPLLHELALTHDETVLFGLYLPTERAMCFAARADGHQMLKYEIELHRPLSLVWGASGKAILAFLPENIVRTILASEGPSPGSGLAPPPFTQLERELRRVREQGYSVSESQKLPDARGIAAPVFGPAGVLGCICLTSPRSRALRDSVEAVAKDVATHAAAFSRDLGAQPARHD